MNKQIEILKSKLNEKVAQIDRRLLKCEKDVLIDHSEYRERLHSEARGYERVLKMIEELPDPIPLQTIKPGDKVKAIHNPQLGIGTVYFIINDSSLWILWSELNQNALHLGNLVDLEVIPNE